MDVERLTVFPNFFGVPGAEDFLGVWAMVPEHARQTSTLFLLCFITNSVYGLFTVLTFFMVLPELAA